MKDQIYCNTSNKYNNDFLVFNKLPVGGKDGDKMKRVKNLILDLVNGKPINVKDALDAIIPGVSKNKDFVKDVKDISDTCENIRKNPNPQNIIKGIRKIVECIMNILRGMILHKYR